MQIYAICDSQTLTQRGISLFDFLEIIKKQSTKYDIKYIQYRDKISDLETQKNNLSLLKSNTRIPIIINDHIELLEFVDGIHFGQEDLDKLKNETFKIKDETLLFKFLRKKYPHKIFGLSIFVII